MPNNLSNALGTQMQFQRQPQNTYQRRLIGRTDVTSGAAEEEAGIRLARSLGVLGESVNTMMVDQEQQRKKVGIAEAQRIMQATSPEDLRRKKAQDILAQTGSIQTADNPYAVALIEEGQGTLIARDRQFAYYDQIIQQQGYAKTAEEEQARFQKFMQEGLTGAEELITDKNAFTSGYWANQEKAHTALFEQFYKVKSANDDAIRQSTAQAKYTDLAENSIGQPAEEYKEKLQAVADFVSHGNAQVPERLALFRGHLMDIARKYGGKDKIQYALDNIILGYDEKTGKPHLAREIIGDVGDILRIAEDTTASLNLTREIDAKLSLQKMSVPEQTLYYENLYKNDFDFYKVMSRHREGAIAAAQEREQRQQRAAVNQHARQKAANNAYALLDAQAAAIRAGKPVDAYGNPINQEPKLHWTEWNADGTSTEKTNSLTPEMKIDWAARASAQVDRRQDLTEDQKVHEKMNILIMPAGEDLAKSYRRLAEDAMDSLTVDKLAQDTSGNTILPDHLERAMEGYKVDPEKAKRIYGDDLIRDLDFLTSTTNAGNSLSQAVETFAQSKDILRDPQLRKEKERAVEEALGNTVTLSDFIKIDGTTTAVNLTRNGYLKKQMRDYALLQYASGKSPQQAVQIAKEQLRAHNYVWEDTVIPRSIFNDFPVDRPYELGMETLQSLKDDFANRTGTSASLVMADWNPDRRILTFRNGSDTPQSYSVPEIVNQGMYLLSLKSSTGAGADTTLAEAQEVRQRWIWDPSKAWDDISLDPLAGLT